MERKEATLKTECLRMLLVSMAVLLSAAPILRADMTVWPGDPCDIHYDVGGVLNVYGIADVNTGFYAANGIYAFQGSTVNIRGGAIGAGHGVTVSNYNPDPIVTVYGTDFAITNVSGDATFDDPVNPTKIIPVPGPRWSGVLTGTYGEEHGGGPINLLFHSFDVIYLVDTGGTITVQIDIKPGSYPNAINLGANGVIPVAILSSDTFDATTVDPETVSLAGLAGVAVRGKGSKSLASEEDVNGDGLPDLVVKIDTENLAPGDLQSGSVLVTGTTFEGQDIEGQDDIVIVPPE